MKYSVSPIAGSQSFGSLWFKDGGRERLEADLGKKAIEFERKVDEFEGVDVFVSRDRIGIQDNDLLDTHYINRETPTSRFMGHIVGNFNNEKCYVPSASWSKMSVKKYGDQPNQIAYAVVEKVAEELSSGKSTLRNFIKLFR